MKILKGISLFVIYPVVMLSLGFLGGVLFIDTFYPNKDGVTGDFSGGSALVRDVTGLQAGVANAQTGNQSGQSLIAEANGAAENTPVLADDERLNADTAYVLEEMDVNTSSSVETIWSIPAKYIGMNRIQFLDAREDYENAPPLSEIERGFVGLEVLSFSKERVVIQMNYEYVQPTNSFYLQVENNFVVVYLDDLETVYMTTDIMLTDLPDEVQQEIIHVKYMPDETSLYDFLETYSS
jgi:hypothetical protein